MPDAPHPVTPSPEANEAAVDEFNNIYDGPETDVDWLIGKALTAAYRTDRVLPAAVVEGVVEALEALSDTIGSAVFSEPFAGCSCIGPGPSDPHPQSCYEAYARAALATLRGEVSDV